MSNILLVYANEETTVILLREALSRFAKQYNSNLRSIRTCSFTQADLLWSDVVVDVRGQSDFEASIAKMARDSGRFFTYFIDDDFLAIPEHHVRRPQCENAILRILKYSNFVLSSNVTLAKRMCTLGRVKRFAILPTQVDQAEIALPKQTCTNDTHRIAYYVNDGCVTDFNNIITPALSALSERFLNTLTWTLIGVRPDVSAALGKSNIEYVEHMPYSDFKAFLRNEHFDIGIAPLQNTSFGICKFVNKFFEFTAAGIPCIYSAVEPYRSFIINRENGILVDNTVTDWYTAIEEMLNNAALRRHCIEAAQEKMRKEFSPNAVLTQLRVSMPELVEYQASKNVEIRGFFYAKCRNTFFSMADPFINAYGRFRLDGLTSVLHRIWELCMGRQEKRKKL